jgi:hypothetical protein
MYTLHWVESAIEKLWKMMIRASLSTGPRISAAVDEIDRVLRIDPESAGESREPRRRIFFIPPLAVKFQVEPRLRIVTVLDIWQYGKRD